MGVESQWPEVMLGWDQTQRDSGWKKVVLESALSVFKVGKTFFLAVLTRLAPRPAHRLDQLLPEDSKRDHSLAFPIAEAKNAWNFTSVPPYVFMA